MTGHVPFDACNNWNPPTCGNTSYDPLVDKLIGNAYHVVRTVYCNLGNLKLIYDFLSQYGMVLGVRSEDELKAMTTSATYVRWYGFTNTNQRIVTDYLYVEGDRTGILPDDATATGSWIEVAVTGSDPEPGIGTSDVTPYVYNNGSALGGETVIAVPSQTVGVPFLIKNHDTYMVGLGFEYDPATLHVTLDTPLNEGDEVIFLLSGTPAVPDNPLVTDWIQFNWLFNGGYATGGEQVIHIPYTFQSVPAIYKNGARFYQGLVDKSYTVDVVNQRILLTEPLAANDRLIVTVGGESRTVFLSDRSIEEIARAANVKDSEVIKSTDDTQLLAGKKIVYDEVAQKSYALPTIPANSYISSVSNGQLTYNPGNVTVDLNPVPVPALDKFALDLLSASGAEMLGYKLNLPGTTARKVNERLYVHVSVLDFGAVGDWDPVTQTGTNDTLAFQAAIDAVSAAGGGTVYVPPGSYCVSEVALKSYVTVYGAGVSTVIYQREDTEQCIIFGTNFNGGGTSSILDNIQDVGVRDIKFVRVNRTTYVTAADTIQYRHMIKFDATTNFQVRNCVFRGFNGDGIYIGGGVGPSVERHNVNGEITGNLFEGVDYQNRNGISVIDCENLLIANNSFRAVSNQLQPGPIDLEPNGYTFHRLLDVRIINNRFAACKGGANIAVHIPDVNFGTPPSGVLIAFNDIDGADYSNGGFYLTHGGAATDSRRNDVRIIGNKVTRTNRPFDIKGMNGVIVEGNIFRDTTYDGLLGWTTADYKNKNVKVHNNILREIGTISGRGVSIFTNDNVEVSDNDFINNGNSAGTSGVALYFTTGTTTYISIKDNKFKNLGRTLIAIDSSAHVFVPETNSMHGNIYQNCANLSFPAVDSDETETQYTPVVRGSTTTGTTTYTSRRCRYRKQGREVTLRAEIVVSATNAAGQVEIELPTKAVSEVTSVSGIMHVFCTGTAITGDSGLLVALIYPAILSNGNSVVRLFTKNGAALNFSGSGTMNIILSGTYMAE